MKTSSFSRETKEALCLCAVKSKCCRRALLCGILMFRPPAENEIITLLYEKLALEFLSGGGVENEDIFVCDSCRRCYLRGVFLNCGFISNPEKSSHLELYMPDLESAFDIGNMLLDFGIETKQAFRNNSIYLYLKNNEHIADFLNLIGAQNASFMLTDQQILRTYRNNANRRANFDTANIKRSVDAASKYIKAIQYFIGNGEIKKFPLELYETAMLRIENEEVTLTELAEMHDPPITKSGINHRLNKILELYNKIQLNENK